jgi:hypothetical protein
MNHPAIMHKRIALLQGLLRATEAGELRWEPVPEHQAFTVEINGYAVDVCLAADEGDAVMTIRRDGDVVEDFDGFCLEMVSRGSQVQLRHLYILARRIAMQADAALDQIIKQLEGK